MPDLLRLPSGEYRHNGRTIPGVTKVLAFLRPYAGVPRETLAFAQQRGQAAHRAIHLLEGGGDGSGLHWQSLSPLVRPYVEAWEKFKGDMRWVTIATEQPVVSNLYGFACTPDLVGTMRGIPTVIDAKCGLALLVALQTAAQAQAIKESRRLKVKPRRHSLSLRSNGSYKLSPEYTDGADLPAFLNLLGIYQWLAKYQARLIPAEVEPDFSNFEEVILP